jgi:hypothetical protein
MSAIEQQSTLTTKGSIGRDGKLTSKMWKALLCIIGFSRNTNRKRKITLRHFKSVTACINGMHSILQHCTIPHLKELKLGRPKVLSGLTSSLV